MIRAGQPTMVQHEGREIPLSELVNRPVSFGVPTAGITTEALMPPYQDAAVQIPQDRKTSAQIRAETFVGTPPTSNLTNWQLAKMLLAHPEAPVCVLFDNQAGIASELYVITGLSDPPDWADPSTVYIDAHGG